MPEVTDNKNPGKTKARTIRLALYMVILLAVFFWDHHRRAQFDYTVIPLTAEQLEQIQASIKASAERQRRIDTLHAMMDKAMDAANRYAVPEECCRLYREIIDTFQNDESEYIQKNVSWAMANLPDYVQDAQEKIRLYEIVIDRCHDAKDNEVNSYVIVPFFEILRLLDGNAEKYAFCERILGKYSDRLTDRAAAWLFSKKAELAQNRDEKASLYDTVVSRFLSSPNDNAFDHAVGAAFNKMKLIDDETEKIHLCDIVIDAFLKTPQRTRYHVFQKAAEEKAKLIDEPSLPLVLWDQVIQNNVTEEAVVQARIERLPLLPNDRERLAACDELIAAHQASMSDYAQLMVARAMIQKARFIPDTEEKAAILRATFEKCASIMDSRARVVASDALALLATLDRDVAAVIHYYDELSAMSEEQRDMLRALEKNTGLLAGPMEKILAYDEVIESSANADSRESREIAAMAMLEKAELTDDVDEKIKLYDAMLFEMGDIRGRYFFSHIFRDRIDMTADVDEQWGVLDYYDDVHGNYLDPDTLMLRDLDSVVVMLNNGHPYGALHLCGIVIDFCEKYLNSKESAYGVSLGKDFERTSIMDTLGKAILFKANSITSVDGKIELYDKYLSFPQPELPHFMNALAEKIRAKNAELITGTKPFLFI